MSIPPNPPPTATTNQTSPTNSPERKKVRFTPIIPPNGDSASPAEFTPRNLPTPHAISPGLFDLNLFGLKGFSVHTDLRIKTLANGDNLTRDITLALKNLEKPKDQDRETPLLMAKLVSRLIPKAHTIRKEFTSYKLITPEDESLNEIAAFYYEKYGINLSTIRVNDLEEAIKKQIETKEDALLGWIVLEKDPEKKHVTPVLLQFNFSSENGHQIVVMDAPGMSEPQTRAQEIFEKAFPTRTTVFVCTEKTQLAMYSCRNDALTLLRNALLHLKHLKEKNQSTDLFEILKIDPSLVTSTFSAVVFENIATLPASWKYTRSVLKIALTEEEKTELVVRDLFSKQKDKKVKKIGDFRSYFDRKASVAIWYQMPSNDSSEKSEEWGFKCEMPTNMYLIEKGLGYALKFGAKNSTDRVISPPKAREKPKVAQRLQFDPD